MHTSTGDRLETFKGEGLKTLAEFGLHKLARSGWPGRKALALARGGPRVQDCRLQTEVAGLCFENPVMVGAGWDKKGWAIDGLYALGFCGVEVGTVLVHPQSGNPQPRLFTDPQTHSVSLNRMGFNSRGMEAVAEKLAQQRRVGITGISLGKNKVSPAHHAAWEHATVAERLYDYADYFVINVASPNTPGLRDLLKNPKPLTEIIQAVQEVLEKKGTKPLFVKTTVDLDLADFDQVIGVCIDHGVTGIIDTNTTIDNEIKSRYGWADQMGGVSGSDRAFRELATERMKHLTRVSAGTGLQRIGVGAINNAVSAMERIKAGAQVVQVVTAIREHKGGVARTINAGLVELLEKEGAAGISELVGTDLLP